MYTLTYDDTTATFARKALAIKAGEATGKGFTVTSPKGKLVHEHDAEPVVTVKVCKKDPTHGEHRLTKSGSYCYACDRIVAERQKAARAAAKVAS